CRQLFLQSDARIARQLTVVLGPCRLDQSSAMHAIGEMSHRDRVGIGVVVFLQYIEVFRNDKTRAFGTARKEKNSLSGRWKRFSVRATHAQILPFGKASAAAHVIEALRHSNLETPG